MLNLHEFQSLSYFDRSKEIDACPIKRGEYVLPHQSQQLRRDLCGEEIARHLGATCMGYMLSDDQYKRRVSHYYRYLVYSPTSCAMSWAAFETLDAMRTWANAYGVTLRPQEPIPGERFDVIFPTSTDTWAPMNGEIDTRFMPEED